MQEVVKVKGKPSIMMKEILTHKQLQNRQLKLVLLLKYTYLRHYGINHLRFEYVKSCYSLEIVGNVNLTTINLSGLTEVFEYGYISSNNALGDLISCLNLLFMLVLALKFVKPALTSFIPVLSKKIIKNG
jgi:hypothetical protein